MRKATSRRFLQEGERNKTEPKLAEIHARVLAARAAVEYMAAARARVSARSRRFVLAQLEGDLEEADILLSKMAAGGKP